MSGELMPACWYFLDWSEVMKCGSLSSLLKQFYYCKVWFLHTYGAACTWSRKLAAVCMCNGLYRTWRGACLEGVCVNACRKKIVPSSLPKATSYHWTWSSTPSSLPLCSTPFRLLGLACIHLEGWHPRVIHRGSKVAAAIAGGGGEAPAIRWRPALGSWCCRRQSR
jgi:hypothetical protein